MSFLNIIPERDEEPSRSERSFAMTRPTEANSVEADLREARCAVKEMQEEEESEEETPKKPTAKELMEQEKAKKREELRQQRESEKTAMKSFNKDTSV